MKRLRARLTPMLLMALSACWSGPAWYGPTDAVAPLPVGRYFMNQVGSPPRDGETIDLERSGNNSYRVADNDRMEDAIFVPLGPRNGGPFIVQIRPAEIPASSAALYVLLERVGARFYLSVPACDAPVQALVEGLGGRIWRDAGIQPICEYNDRSAMEARMRRFADTRPRQVELTLIHKP